MASQRPTQDVSPFLGASADGRLAELTAAEPSATPTADTTEPQVESDADPPAWTPGDDTRDPHVCQKCGAHLSARWRRVWSENGENTVRYCRECVPRSVRFGRDPYGRSPEDFDPGDFDVDSHNA